MTEQPGGPAEGRRTPTHDEVREAGDRAIARYGAGDDPLLDRLHEAELAELRKFAGAPEQSAPGTATPPELGEADQAPGGQHGSGREGPNVPER